MNFLGQSKQDEFVIKMLNYKKNGYFLEIGSNHPININNSYILEKEYGWNGLMVEYDKKYESLYGIHRSSHYIIQDATTINYEDLFVKYNFPNKMDYLQIDLEVSNNSTLNTLQLLNNTIMQNYTFNIVTFEHDIYSGNYFNTQAISRQILKDRGYVLAFPNVSVFWMESYKPFEDWYVHPDLVDMEYVNRIRTNETMNWDQIVQRFGN